MRASIRAPNRAGTLEARIIYGGCSPSKPALSTVAALIELS